VTARFLKEALKGDTRKTGEEVEALMLRSNSIVKEIP
jgi:hypothetical protein